MFKKKGCTHGSFLQYDYCNSLFGNHIKDNEITILIRAFLAINLTEIGKLKNVCIVSAISQGIPITMGAKCF